MEEIMAVTVVRVVTIVVATLVAETLVHQWPGYGERGKG